MPPEVEVTVFALPPPPLGPPLLQMSIFCWEGRGDRGRVSMCRCDYESLLNVSNIDLKLPQNTSIMAVTMLQSFLRSVFGLYGIIDQLH